MYIYMYVCVYICAHTHIWTHDNKMALFLILLLPTTNTHLRLLEHAYGKFHLNTHEITYGARNSKGTQRIPQGTPRETRKRYV